MNTSAHRRITISNNVAKYTRWWCVSVYRWVSILLVIMFDALNPKRVNSSNSLCAERMLLCINIQHEFRIPRLGRLSNSALDLHTLLDISSEFSFKRLLSRTVSIDKQKLCYLMHSRFVCVCVCMSYFSLSPASIGVRLSLNSNKCYPKVAA